MVHDIVRFVLCFCLTLSVAIRSKGAWTGPALRVNHTAQADGLPVLTINESWHQPPLWLTLHLYYTNMSQFEYQINRSVAVGMNAITICLTRDVSIVGQSGFDPWLSEKSPLDERTRNMLDRIVQLHPQVVATGYIHADPAMPTTQCSARCV